jgi:3-oxoacid CoA-transferase subunit B
MDLVAGVRASWSWSWNTTRKDGAPKFKPRCDLPLTGANCVDMLITDLAVFERRTASHLSASLKWRPV